MPIRRYEVRSEYALGDPELYKAADKDDPEALLEGVAMSALVGLLRQLGDLAEFAAEIFHDLHEEVMATAARGHDLMARVQQLEAEVPSIEKAFLSQTNHSPFFNNSGVEWRANLRMEHNLITRGDLPRFVMDSYEECRGPPRLFLLDKFDVAGAGACLKRYTDPSFFKVEMASSEISTAETQREKKVRKAKKKASRWRNGQTPEVAAASHPKLQQLFLEERVENGHSDPARLVKLKRRHLNGSQFDINSGRSYMEKFAATPSPENKKVCSESVSSPLRLTYDIPGESELDIHEIDMASPVKESSQERTTLFSPVVVEQDASETFSDELNEGSLDTAIVKVSDPVSVADTDESSSVIMAEGSADGIHSDDMNSEVENFMDALATMDSEMETDNEYKLKMDGALKIIEKDGTVFDANQSHMDVQGNFSDSQSIGNSSLSYDRNSSVRRGQGSFSCSDSLSQLAENTLSDSEGPMKTSSVTGSRATEIIESPPGSSYRVVETEGTESFAHAESADACFEASKMADPGETSFSLCPLDSKTAVPGSDLTTSDISTSEFVNLYLGNSNSQDSPVAVSSENHVKPDLDQEDQDLLLDSLVHRSFSKEVDIHNTADNIVGDEDNNEEKDLSEEKIDTLEPIMTPSNEHLLCSTSAELETISLVTSSPEALDVVRSKNLHFVVNPPIPPTAEFSKPNEMEELERSSATVDVSQNEINSEADVPIPHSEDSMNIEQASGFLDDKEKVGLSSEVATDVASFEEAGLSTEDSMNIEQASGFLDDKEKVGLSSEVATDVASFEEAGLSTVQLDSQDEEEIGRIANRVNEVTGNAVLSEQTDFSELESSDQSLSNIEVAEVLEGEDADPCAASATDGTNASADNLASLTSDVFSPSSDGLLVVQQSLSGSKVQHEEELSQESIAPGCPAQLQALQEVKQDRTFVITDYGLHKSETDQDSVFDNGASSAGQGDWDVVPETVSDIKSGENGHRVVSSSLTPVESSAELSGNRLNEKIPTSNLRTLVGADSRSLRILEFVSSAEESADQPHQPRKQFSEENEPSFSSEFLSIPGPVSSTEHSLDFHLNQNKVHGDNDEPRRFDDPLGPSASGLEGLPSQAPLLQLSDDKLKALPFSFAFPNAGLQHESTSVNLEDTPPLPPLPPMQWRMGKVQPASVISEREGVDQTPDAFSLMQPCTLPHGLTFSETESSVPSPHHPDKDSIRQQQLSAPPNVDVHQTMNEVADSWQDGRNMVEAQLSNQVLSPSEVLDEKSDRSQLEVDQEEKQNTSNLSSIESAVPIEPSSSGCGTVSLDDFRASQPVISEMHEAGSHNLVDEEVIVPDTSMEKPSQVERQATDDQMASQGETSWSTSTLALPPAYGVGNLNGSKLPLPRNPLIDAVAAHDKSKLRKVAERVRPQLGPKLEERDTLLEQIRTKSFNLKPPSVTRPGVQAMPGPKTNLRVAAILEKANAIRQAFAGSDEDEDSDSWSDS